ncbi:uncharacterized protein N7515_004917 [Penicillium bovifimosum]|uniref:Uncharacterized protein n=1 Tax=Penicillium bovifimosum TaxID=126998 RepID=A0A9W9H109_9EURO|nr:uncharacterized protein N7515_004917 [Penicillium bovifimosum]KAJ5135639.1 hypothetical protein N7515_004917 [Penicillium bovifimosum]
MAHHARLYLPLIWQRVPLLQRLAASRYLDEPSVPVDDSPNLIQVQSAMSCQGSSIAMADKMPAKAFGPAAMGLN